MKDKLLKIIDLELHARGIKGRGLYLPEGHARAIWEGNKSLILKDRKFNIDNEKLLIFGLHYAYGYVWLDKPFVIRSIKEFDRLRKEHKVTDEQFKRWGWEFPLYAYKIKKKQLFKNPSPIELPRGIQNILINPERYMRRSDIREKALKLTPEDYKKLLKEGDYKNKPLPAKYYVDYREGYAFAQFHIRGIKPEDRDAFLKKKKSFKDIILGHSLHCDIRWHLRGVDKLIQGILVESDIESYIRVLLGELNKEQKGPANVQKGLFLSKERMQIEEPSNMRIKKTKEYLIDEKGAEIIDKYIMKDKSFWIVPGDVGCVSSDTLVLTDHGYEYIRNIQKGDLVYTHKGRFKKVLNVIKKERKNWNFKIAAYKGFPVNFTNHNIFIGEDNLKEIDKLSSEDRLYLAKPAIDEIEPSDLELEIPPGYKKKVKWNEDLAEWIGYFIGDGSVTNVDKGDICFSCASKEEAEKYAELSKRLFGVNTHIYPRRNYRKPKEDNHISYWDLEFKDRGLAKWLSKNCYHHRKGKTGRYRFKIFPYEAIYHPLRLLEKYIAGFREADSANSKNLCGIGSTSRYAIGQAYFMLLRMNKQPNIDFVEDKRKDRKRFFRVTWVENRQTQQKSKEVEHGYSLPIKILKYNGNSSIHQYDLTVEDDHSYTVSNFHVSNSTPYTFAYLGAIWTGKVKTGVERMDYHELFFYSDTDQPELNQKFLNGRFIIKAFKRPQGSPLYWIWKATADPEPENPYCHLDMGYHPIMLETKIKYFKKEDYPEWDKRKEICT